MATSADFLVEIGTEELPPSALSHLENAFRESLRAGATTAGLGMQDIESFATPRRLAVLIYGLDLRQPARKLEKRGPPVNIAFDADGNPTRAAQAFAASCGVEVAALERLLTDKGEWLYFRGEQPGAGAADLLPALVDEALAGLPIPKRMRWGAHEAEFVRPVHWAVMMLGETVVDTEILGQRTGNVTRGHRFHAPALIPIRRPADYATSLREHGQVIAEFATRRARIRELASQAAADLGGEVIVEPAVLDEVTALVEWPVAVAGRFDPAFLELPREVIIATLQAHQRYFPVQACSGKLLAGFVAISNVESRDPEQVRAGNERVVHPRLADAAFFWQQDRRSSLAGRRESLRNVVFEGDLGTLYDKSNRVRDLAVAFGRETQADPAIVTRAAELAKTDLLTAMVGEFPELQGRMGYRYALEDGEPEAVATAIEEQYLPRHAGDRLPATPAGSALAVADRLDTLAGIFAIGKRPTGNKDPFGLRRAALGVLRILIEAEIDANVVDYLERAVAAQPSHVPDVEALRQDLYTFIIDRLRAYYLEGLAPGFAAGTVTPEMFAAVRARAPVSPLDFHQRLTAVHSFMGLDAAESLALANKRIANILRSADEAADRRIDPELFDADEERRLYAAVGEITTAHQSGLQRRDYTSILHGLAGLKEPLDAFFDAVLVMTDDDQRRRNRLAQLGRLRQLFLDVADLSCIPAA